jgi:hypothetical protein
MHDGACAPGWAVAAWAVVLSCPLACSSPTASLTPRLVGSSTSAGVTSSGTSSVGLSSSSSSSSSGTSATGNSASATTTSAGNNGSSTSSTSSSTSSTGAGVACGPSAIWQGDYCVRTSCAEAPLYARCLLPDDGLGNCAAGTCQVLDFSSDPTNCGGFGVACPKDSDCGNGACQSRLPSDSDGNCTGQKSSCPTGMVSATGSFCGNAFCIFETCDDTVPDRVCYSWTNHAYGICCGSSCIDPTFDSSHCGACGHACATGEVCGQVAIGFGTQLSPTQIPSTWASKNFRPYAGVCTAGAPCDAAHNNAVCELDGGGTGQCCMGECLSLAFRACGACGQTCPTTPGYCWLRYDMPCDAGSACDPTRGSYPTMNCSPLSCTGLQDGMACTAPQAVDPLQCCGGACVDVLSDPSNCGICGLPCPAGTSCESGLCVIPVDCTVAVDGTPCALGNGAGICCNGACVSALANQGCGYSCDPHSRSDCTYMNNEPPGSCCAGSCLAANTPCEESICPADSDGENCPFGPGMMGTCCAGNCVNLPEDPTNCGACGVSCGSGVCAGQCLPSLADTNCGTCPEATVCARGQCVDSFCDSPLHVASETNPQYPAPFFCAAADGQLGFCSGPSGYCSDLANDPLNCGGFGFACPGGQTCAKGVCSGQTSDCGIGRIGASCNANAGSSYLCCPGVGCTDTNTDLSNCGGCNIACAPGQSCIAGTCA